MKMVFVCTNNLKVMLIVCLIQSGCSSRERPSQALKRQIQNQETVPLIEKTADEGLEVNWNDLIADYIDEYAGHPDDPTYPTGYVGPSDYVVEQTNPREILDLINEGLSFAKSKVSSEPRFLFALGRAAYLHNYRKESKEWLKLAADNGSSGAMAYLGFIAYEDENIDLARSYLKAAIRGGFTNETVDEIYKACNFDALSYDFDRPDLINALYSENWNVLKNDNIAAFYIPKIHATLWEYDILWIAEDSQILMELDSDLGREAQNILEKFFGNTITEATLQSAIKDARCMAMLYGNNPVAFRKIYSGIGKFMRNNK